MVSTKRRRKRSRRRRRVRLAWRGEPVLRGRIERDQWTVYGSYNPDRPLYHFAMDDAPGTEFYVASTSGEIVQMTTRHVRFWNWIGAVVHWL